jgi:hypothetical protein
MESEQQGSGSLTIFRLADRQDWLRSYEIFVDGQSIGRIKRNAHLTIELPAGSD